MIIAVDGPSAAGKGTLARAIAKELGYHFLDTGSLYRMVGLAMLRQRLDLADESTAARIAAVLEPASFADQDLRSEEVASAASQVSVLPKVRANLLQLQRDFAARAPGAVLDGRDIGTIVCPDAHIKLFVTASTEVRARRRLQELRAGGADISYAAVLADVEARDARDASRPISPMKPASDAIVIDTTQLDVAQALAAAMAIIRSKR